MDLHSVLPIFFNILKYIGIFALIVVLLSFILILILVLIKPKKLYTKSELEHIQKAKRCYEPIKTNQKLYSLEDIMKSPPKLDKTIFFHDTTCARDKNGTVTFTAR